MPASPVQVLKHGEKRQSEVGTESDRIGQTEVIKYVLLCNGPLQMSHFVRPMIFAEPAQAQLRHSKLEMTGWYMREIPESVRAAVAEMDAQISQTTESIAATLMMGGRNERQATAAIWWGRGA